MSHSSQQFWNDQLGVPEQGDTSSAPSPQSRNIFTRVLPSSDKCFTVLVGKDSGLGSTFAEQSSESVNSGDQTFSSLEILDQSASHSYCTMMEWPSGTQRILETGLNPGIIETLEGNRPCVNIFRDIQSLQDQLLTGGGAGQLSVMSSQQSKTRHQLVAGQYLTTEPSLPRQQPLLDHQLMKGQLSVEKSQSFCKQQPVIQEHCLVVEQETMSAEQFVPDKQPDVEVAYDWDVHGSRSNDAEKFVGTSSDWCLTCPVQVASDSQNCKYWPSYLDNYTNSLSVSHLPNCLSLAQVPSEDDLNDIVIHNYEFREDFKEDQYDIVLIYSENDRNQALAFREILTKFVILANDKPPSICVLDQNVHLTYITSRFSHMEEALKRSTYMFLFLTKDFCVDSWAQLQRDECLMESIHNPDKKWCVVPILTKPRKEADYKMPFGLRALKGVEIAHMLRGETLNSVNVENLQAKDVDPYFLKNMRKMLSDRIYLKEERQRQQLVEFQEWLKEEKHRRWKIKQKEKVAQNLADKRRAVERLKLEQELKYQEEHELGVVEEATKKKAEAEAVEHIRKIRAASDARCFEMPLTNRPALHNPEFEKKSCGTKAKMEGVKSIHNHYYAPVTQASEKHTVYHLHGPVSESLIGNHNRLTKENNDHVLLDQTNLEMDAPDATECLVEEEEVCTPCEPAAVLHGCHADFDINSSSFLTTFKANVMIDGQKPRDSEVSVVTLPMATSSPVTVCGVQKHARNSGSKKISFAVQKHPPEVDRPQSPMFESTRQDVQPHMKVISSPCNSATAEDLTFATNVVDAGGSVKHHKMSRKFSSESSERPMAAVAPICQNSEQVENCEVENDDTMLKSPIKDEDQTRLKQYSHAETSVKLISRKGLRTKDEEDFVVINKIDITAKPSFESDTNQKKLIQTGGIARTMHTDAKYGTMEKIDAHEQDCTSPQIASSGAFEIKPLNCADQRKDAPTDDKRLLTEKLDGNQDSMNRSLHDKQHLGLSSNGSTLCPEHSPYPATANKTSCLIS